MDPQEGPARFRSPLGPVSDSNSPPTQLSLFKTMGTCPKLGDLLMGSDGDPPRTRPELGVLLGGDQRLVQQSKSSQRAGELFELLSSSLGAPASPPPDDERQRDDVDNVSAVLEANARLRALALRLSNMLENLSVREWECGPELQQP